MTPYRVISEFMKNIDPNHAIVTHDSGSPRDQLMPFYRAGGAHTYLGWGKSHGLGTGLGLNMGAKLADPDKFVVNFMGDAAFRHDRSRLRDGCAFGNTYSNRRTEQLVDGDRDLSYGSIFTSYTTPATLGGSYADLGTAMGGWAERIKDPSDVGPRNPAGQGRH